MAKRGTGLVASAIVMALGALVACVGDDAAPAATDAADASADSGSSGALPDASAGGDAAVDAPSGDAADAGPWTPRALDDASELALWLAASTDDVVISNGRVATWRDRSKNHNDATNSQNGPALDKGAVNAHDALHFTDFAVALQIADGASLQFGTDQVYLAAVAKVSSSATAQSFFFSKASTTNSGAGPLYASGLQFYAMMTSGPTSTFPVAHVDANAGNELAWNDSVFDDGKFHVVSLRRPSSFALTMTVDDQVARNGSTGAFDLSQAGVDARVGSVKFGNLTKTVDFELAELVVIHGSTGVVADDDVAKVHAYLKSKYGL